LSFQFATLGSGSKGNATVIRTSKTTILLDCGFTLRELTARLALVGCSPTDLDAVIVTHEHSDHCKGVGATARKLKMPVYMTPGTRMARDYGVLPNAKLIEGYQPFEIGDINVLPVAVPHDAREPSQFVFEREGLRLGILTDLGCITPHVLQAYSYCDGLILEANHDPEMLSFGPYPPSLKLRVGGDWGHLSNGQAASFLSLAQLPNLQHLVVAHMSEKNNSLAKVKLALEGHASALPIYYANQTTPSDWFSLSHT